MFAMENFSIHHFATFLIHLGQHFIQSAGDNHYEIVSKSGLKFNIKVFSYSICREVRMSFPVSRELCAEKLGKLPSQDVRKSNSRLRGLLRLAISQNFLSVNSRGSIRPEISVKFKS